MLYNMIYNFLLRIIIYFITNFEQEVLSTLEYYNPTFNVEFNPTNK